MSKAHVTTEAEALDSLDEPGRDPFVMDAVWQSFLQQRFRKAPIMANDVRGLNLVNVLAEQLLKHPPRDLRLSGDADSLTFYSQDYSDEYTKDIVNSMQQAVLRKDLEHGNLFIAVKFVKNAEAFFAYNEAIQKFNQGRPGYDPETDAVIWPEAHFNPITGEKTWDHVRVTPAIMQDPFLRLPSNTQQGVDGIYKDKRPVEEYATRVIVQYHITMQNEVFFVEYVARTPDNQVLYYDTAFGPDLTKVVMQTTQGLYGNFEISGSKGPFAEGAVHLVHGKKIHVCRRRVKVLPSILNAKEPVKSDVGLRAADTSIGVLCRLSGIVGLWGPIVAGVLAVWKMISWIANSNPSADTLHGPVSISPAEIWFWVMIFGIVTLGALSYKLSKYLREKASEIKVHQATM